MVLMEFIRFMDLQEIFVFRGLRVFADDARCFVQG
jgi:hypothetical protein